MDNNEIKQKVIEQIAAYEQLEKEFEKEQKIKLIKISGGAMEALLKNGVPTEEATALVQKWTCHEE